jgi:hypothetical protein
MQNHHHHIEASLLRFIADFATEHGIGALYLDGFTDEDQWPTGDFIGVGEINQDISEFFEGQCAIAISTVGDTNLQRMRSLMAPLVQKLLPNSNIPIYHSETGLEIGKLFVMSGVRVGSPIVTKTQPIRPVTFQFTSNLTSAS